MINTKMVEAFTKLINSADRLNKSSDELNAAVLELQSRVNSLNIGVEAVIEVRPGLKLGFTQSNKKWGFYIMTNESFWEFNNAPRHLRIICSDYLPHLIDKLVENAKAVLADVIKATTMATEIAKALNGSTND